MAAAGACRLGLDAFRQLPLAKASKRRIEGTLPTAIPLHTGMLKHIDRSGRSWPLRVSSPDG